MSELTTTSKLPTIAELTTDIEAAYKSDELNMLLSQSPPAKWVKVHPYIKEYKYLPIDKREYLLRKIFKQYRIEITGQGTAFNGVWVTVRVHYLNPALNEWSYHDGIGSTQLQTKSGTSPADLRNINNGAIAMAFPLAKTEAIKDATDMFGDLFGANLNRRDTLSYVTDDNIKTAVEDKRLKLISKCETLKQLKQFEDLKDVSPELFDAYTAKFDELKHIDDAE